MQAQTCIVKCRELVVFVVNAWTTTKITSGVPTTSLQRTDTLKNRVATAALNTSNIEGYVQSCTSTSTSTHQHQLCWGSRHFSVITYGGFACQTLWHCVCVCVWVCEIERQREQERESERECAGRQPYCTFFSCLDCCVCISLCVCTHTISLLLALLVCLWIAESQAGWESVVRWECGSLFLHGLK